MLQTKWARPICPLRFFRFPTRTSTCFFSPTSLGARAREPAIREKSSKIRLFELDQHAAKNLCPDKFQKSRQLSHQVNCSERAESTAVRIEFTGPHTPVHHITKSCRFRMLLLVAIDVLTMIGPSRHSTVIYSTRITQQRTLHG